jgi:hypothetical protein
MITASRITPPPRSPTRGETETLRGAGRRLFALCLAALVLMGALTAGRTYLWCSMMEQPVDARCCVTEPTDVTGSELRSGCCETRGHDEIAMARVPSGGVEIPPAVVAIAPPAPALSVAISVASYSPTPHLRAVRTSHIRAGPGAASATCVKLQVFRC